MKNEIAINTGTLKDDIDLMQTELTQIRNELDNMFNAIQALDTTWKGPANIAFNQQFNIDRQQMKDMCDIIQKIINCLNYANGEYNTCDNEVSEIVAAIQV